MSDSITTPDQPSEGPVSIALTRFMEDHPYTIGVIIHVSILHPFQQYVQKFNDKLASMYSREHVQPLSFIIRPINGGTCDENEYAIVVPDEMHRWCFNMFLIDHEFKKISDWSERQCQLAEENQKKNTEEKTNGN